MKNINHEYYKIFYYVAKCGGFSQGAKALLMNQPNVTRTIKKLEGELGCLLFKRTNHGVILTPEGQALYRHIALAMGHIQAGEEEIEHSKTLERGMITVASSEIALHCVLLPVLRKFRREYPGVGVKVLNHSTPQAMEELKNGVADFAVVTTPMKENRNFESIKIREIQEIPIVSDHFQIEGNRKYTLKDIAKLPYISLGERTNSYRFYQELFHKEGIEFEPDIEAATADQILPMVHSDLGVGFVPVDFYQKDLGKEELREIKLKNPVPKRDICVLKRKDISLSIAAVMMLEKIINYKEDANDLYTNDHEGHENCL